MGNTESIRSIDLYNSNTTEFWSSQLEDGFTAIEAGMSSFGHSGYTGIFTWADPESGILFVFMSNRVFPTRNNSKIYQLNIRPSIHQSIYDARIKAEF